jgi:AsmA protein
MRILLKLLAFIIVIVIIGLITLPFIFDPHDYKQQISDQVEKATGRTLNLEGDIGLSVFPWIALELGPLSLSNAKGFEAAQFAKIDGAQIRIKLMPLLKKELEMDTVVLDGLILNLEKNKAGKTNWDDFGNKEQQEKKEESSTDEPAAGLAALSIAGIELTDANILWSDKSSATHYAIKHLNLKTDPLKPGEPTAVELDFDLTGDAQLAANISLDSQLAADMENQLFTLNDFTFKTKASGQDIPEIDLALTSDITADLKQQTINLSQLRIQTQDLVIESDIKAKQVLSEQPQFEGQLTVAPFNLRQLAKQFAIELPVMADDSTLELITLNSQLSGSADHVNLSDLSLTLDQSELSGQFGIEHFAKPVLTFKLALDAIDADRYLPPADSQAASEKPAVSPATASAAAANELPLETLRDLNIAGSLDIGKLKISGTQSENIHINVNAKNGVVKLQPLSANLYQGNYKGNVNLDARGKNLKLAINESLNNIQAGPLLKDLSGDDKISGLVNAKVKLSGQGKTVEQIKQTLSGNGNFAFTDGSLKGINLAESIRKAKAVLKGQPLPASSDVVKTDFSSFKGSFTANKGRINNPDLLLMSPLLRVNGGGTADLNQEAIDYGLEVGIVGSSEGQQGKDLAELKGLIVPVKITGSFNEPKPTVDLATLLRDNATQKAKDKVQDKLKDKLGDELGDIVGGALLGNKKSRDSDNASDSSDEENTPEKSAEDELKDAIGGTLKGLF